MIGFLVWDRVRIKIRIRVRVSVGVTFSVRVYHWSNCRRGKIPGGGALTFGKGRGVWPQNLKPYP